MPILSDQPRFKSGNTPEEFFATLIQAFNDENPIPKYSSDSRDLDVWLKNFVKTEPHLSGVLNSVTTIDKNRGWSVTGGRNQVNRITDMLHNFECSPGLIGWRPAFGYASRSFWGTNMGCITELGRDGATGPVRKLFNVDPTKCVLTGNINAPLKYYPPRGKVQKWRSDDFFRVVSAVDLDENMNGLGDCAVYRAVGIAQLMVALMRHDAEQLLARAPRGLLLLQGIRRAQWDAAMAANDSELDTNEMRYFGALAVLASASEKVDAKLLALSQLPQAFNMKEWMDWTLYGYALCFGYDASEFWPVQYGALGRGNETQVQHEKATAKGRLDFVLGFQEQIQNFLPDSVDFTVEQRDDQGDLVRASVIQAWANVAKSMYESKDSSGLSLITNEEARVLLAEYGVIPSSWSPTAEVESTDIDEVDMDPEVDPGEAPENNQPKLPSGTVKNPVAASPTAEWLKFPRFDPKQKIIIREMLLGSPQIWRAANKYPKDPIVRYDYSPKSPKGRITTLWESGEDLIHPKIQVRKTREMEEVYGEEEIDPNKMIVLNPNINITLPEGLVGRSSSGEEKIPTYAFGAPGKYEIEQNDKKVNVVVPQPIVNVPAPVINVQFPEWMQQRALAEATPEPEPKQEPNIIFAPVINVPTPEVNIENTVMMPDTKEQFVVVKRDNSGRIVRVEKTSEEV